MVTTSEEELWLRIFVAAIGGLSTQWPDSGAAAAKAEKIADAALNLAVEKWKETL